MRDVNITGRIESTRLHAVRVEQTTSPVKSGDDDIYPLVERCQFHPAGWGKKSTPYVHTYFIHDATPYQIYSWYECMLVVLI